MDEKKIKGKALADIDAFDELIKSPNVPQRFKVALQSSCGKLTNKDQNSCARGFFEGWSACEEVVKKLMDFIKQEGT